MEILVIIAAAWLLFGGDVANGGERVKSFFDVLKAPFPDWVKVLMIGGFLGFAYAGMQGGQEKIWSELQGIRIEMKANRDADEARLRRLLNQSNDEHERMWRAMGRSGEGRRIE